MRSGMRRAAREAGADALRVFCEIPWGVEALCCVMCIFTAALRLAPESAVGAKTSLVHVEL